MFDTLPAIPHSIFVTKSGYTVTRPRKALIKVLTRKGSFRVSVQAGRSLYSKPREDGLSLDQYSEVEVALIGARGFMRPEDFNFSKFGDMFSPYEALAPYAPVKQVLAFMNHCCRVNRCHVVGDSPKMLGNKVRKRNRQERKAARLA